MKLLLSYLKRYRGLVLLSFVLAAVNTGFSLLDPVFFGKMIDSAKGIWDKNATLVDGLYQNMQMGRWEYMIIVGKFALILISVAMVSRIAKAFQDYTVNSVVQKFGADVYTDGLKQALQLPFKKFEDQRSGETLAIMEKVRQDCEKFIMYFINTLFSSVVTVVFIFTYAILYFPRIIIVYLIGALILGLLMSFISKRIKHIQKYIVGETTALAGATTESLRNIELVRSLGLTNQEIGRLNSTTLKILILELKKVKRIRSLSFVQGTLINFMRQAIVFILLLAVFDGEIRMGQIFTFQFFSFFLFNPLQELGNIIISYREAQTSLGNFEELMNTPIEEKPANPLQIGTIKKLAFKGVDFQHTTAKTKALDNISFGADVGETIAFVGPSGSGKTTLVKLLVGLYQPDEGDIQYNGISYDTIDYDDFRHQIGFVTQDTQLFAGTIRENLVFVKPDASDEEMKMALEKASATSLMERAEKGLDTSIGEGGMKVSGGEKQRLSIARALLRKPKLLVFDEATSALDSLTEESITNTIKQISSSRTQINILIAHRLSTIMHADRIYVLEKGKIVETGRHEKLVEDKGLYYAMWRQQIGERYN
jgi:ATP-binding cassette subfamily B protein